MAHVLMSEPLSRDAVEPDGEPIYLINATQIMTAIVPDQLKKKPEQT